MFICNCHGIRSSEIHAACAQGCRTVREIFEQTAGAQPCCGKCVREIHDTLKGRNFAVAAE